MVRRPSRPKRRTLVIALAVTIAAAVGNAGAAAAATGRVAFSQLAPGQLLGVAATSATDAWAVGTTATTFDQSTNSPLVLRWNGAAWSSQSLPSMPHVGLEGVAARAGGSDVWAVGSDATAPGSSKTVTVHWNGASWTRVASPTPGRGGDLAGVAIVSGNNAWAVGRFSQANFFGAPLILHWNGKVWKRVAAPKLPKFFDGGLNAISVRSARDIWAVGSMTNCGCGPGLPLILHWNGKAWKRRARGIGSGGFSLGGVAAVSARRVFVAGTTGEGDAPTRARTARFNGTRWHRLHTPSPGAARKRFDGLSDVAATSARNAFAVGSTDGHLLIERWNGRSWRRAPATLALSPAVAHVDRLEGVAATSARDAWAVGTVQPTATNAMSTLILHWNGAAWSASPTAP